MSTILERPAMEVGTSQTLISMPRRAPSGNPNACLVHIYPTGAAMGTRYALLSNAVVVGRGEDCDIQIPDHSVSRRHAQVQHSETGVVVSDLQSTNGTFVNDKPVTTAGLHDGDYLRIGNCIYRFLAGGNVESEYHEEIYRLTIVDGLTQIHNKRYLLEFLDRELSRSSRHQRPLSLVMIDIDHFKTINDEMGHLGGDFALRELPSVIKASVRREDLFARYGGEEFTLVLVETPLEGAVEVAERIRESVEKHPFRFEERPFSLTISIGVAFTQGDSSLTSAKLLRQADDKLYEAKRAGRNRVVH